MVKTQLSLAAAAVLGFCSFATVANAQSASPFHLLDRPADASSVGVDLSTLFFTDDVDVLIFRLDPHIEHMLNPNLGIMATLPLSYGIAYGDNEGDSVSGIGNLEGGAFYVSPMSRELTLVFRGSINLPTASSEFDELIVNIFSSYARLGDLALAAPKLVLARPAASLIFRSPSVEFRGDFGLDIPLFGTDGNEINDRSPLIRLSGGIAVGSGPTKFVGELVNLIPSDQVDDDSSIHQVGLGISQEMSSGSLNAGLSFIVDGFFEDEAGDVISLNLGYKTVY